MNNTTRIWSLIIAVVMLLSLAACGKDDGSNEFNSVPSGNVIGSQTFTEPTGTGFSLNHAVEAGFGMGIDTLEDIIGRYGQPLEQTTNEYTALTVSSAVYDFGLFEFEGANGAAPVLTYVQINSQKAAPCGIGFGMNLESAANCVLSGSGDGLMTTPEQQIYLYGSDAPGEEYGRYTMLTIEFISSSTNDTYSLEYRADSYDEGHMVQYTVYFNAEYNMTWYSLRYV